MLVRDSQAAYRRKCKKLTGDDNAYVEATEAMKLGNLCVKAWLEIQFTDSDYPNAQSKEKALLKK